MLQILIPKSEFFDETSSTFIETSQQTLCLEHSLISLSKWESKWEKPFLSKDTKTTAETIDYIRCMTLDKNVDENVYLAITNDTINAINEYISAPMTAMHIFNDNNNKNKKEIITSEIIYYWMITFNIPFDCQKWHLNRLLMLIQVCDIKNKPPKKMSKQEIINRNKALNEARKKSLNTKG